MASVLLVPALIIKTFKIINNIVTWGNIKSCKFYHFHYKYSYEGRLPYLGPSDCKVIMFAPFHLYSGLN
jgi:hypothetical protein